MGTLKDKLAACNGQVQLVQGTAGPSPTNPSSSLPASLSSVLSPFLPVKGRVSPVPWRVPQILPVLTVTANEGQAARSTAEPLSQALATACASWCGEGSTAQSPTLLPATSSYVSNFQPSLSKEASGSHEKASHDASSRKGQPAGRHEGS